MPTNALHHIASSDTHTEISKSGVSIRALSSLGDFRACVALQLDVWGPDYDETVPATILQISRYVGGLAAGAFDQSGDLLGFIFGLTGVRDGELVHWSHALGVRESARNVGIGRLLKEYQRAELDRNGIGQIFWTFDPLIATNAHFNLNRLGARVVEYVADMYGTTKSLLHHRLATDRLIVALSTRGPFPVRPDCSIRIEEAAILTRITAGENALPFGNGRRPSSILIEVPTDISQITTDFPGAAAGWQASIRQHFQWALKNGYTVTGLQRDSVTFRSFYTLKLDGNPE